MVTVQKHAPNEASQSPRVCVYVAKHARRHSYVRLCVQCSFGSYAQRGIWLDCASASCRIAISAYGWFTQTCQHMVISLQPGVNSLWSSKCVSWRAISICSNVVVQFLQFSKKQPPHFIQHLTRAPHNKPFITESRGRRFLLTLAGNIKLTFKFTFCNVLINDSQCSHFFLSLCSPHTISWIPWLPGDVRLMTIMRCSFVQVIVLQIIRPNPIKLHMLTV